MTPKDVKKLKKKYGCLSKYNFSTQYVTEGSIQEAHMCTTLTKQKIMGTTLQKLQYTANRQQWVFPRCYLPLLLLRSNQQYIVGSNQKAHIVFFKANFTQNSHYFANFSRKHPGRTHVYFLGATFCDIINKAQGMYYNLSKKFQLYLGKQWQEGQNVSFILKQLHYNSL